MARRESATGLKIIAGEGRGCASTSLPDDTGWPLSAQRRPRAWIGRLSLTDFRNYAQASLALEPVPIVLSGANGAGKTNILEAVSLLAPGRGLRGVPFAELNRQGGAGAWAVSGRLCSLDNEEGIAIGTGLGASAQGARVNGRMVRIDGQASGSGALAEHVQMLWLTPSMDGLFTGPAAERRRFLDRLALCFDPGFRRRAAHYERAMRQRNRLLETGGANVLLDSLEEQMAETGVAIAAARLDTVERLRVMTTRENDGASSVFPVAQLALEGLLEEALVHNPAVEVEDEFINTLAAARERDRAAGRTLIGPHRSDLLVTHAAKAMPARQCSTGEQKALLVGLVLAHAALLRAEREAAPVLLLDEIAAHLDEVRRAALFTEIWRLGIQAWMTGTDRAAFAPLGECTQFFMIGDGKITPER